MRKLYEKHALATLTERLLLYLVVVTFVVKIQFNYFAICGLFIFWIINKRYRLSFEILSQSRIFYALCAYFFFVIISLLYSDNISYGLKTIETKSSLIALPILLTGIHWDVYLRNNVLKLFVLAVLFATLHSIVSTFVQLDIDLSDMAYFSWVLPQTSAFTANYYAMFVVFAIIILIFDFKMFQSEISKTGVIVAIFYLVLFLAFLGSRAAILGLITLVLFFAALKITRQNVRESKRGVMIIFLTIVTGAVMITSVPYVHNRFNQTIFQFKDEPRYHLLTSSISLFLQNPVFGVGVGDVQDKLVEEYRLNKNLEAYEKKYNTHNDWFQVLVSTGLVGLLFFLYFLYQLFKQARKKKNLYMISFLIFFFMVSMTESILERNKGVVFFAFFVTLFFILKFPENQSLESNES